MVTADVRSLLPANLNEIVLLTKNINQKAPFKKLLKNINQKAPLKQIASLLYP